MAIVSVSESHEGRPGSRTPESNDYTRTFLVIVSAATDDQETVLSATGIPTLWSAHPSNAYATCRKLNAETFGDDRLYWLVKAEYSTSKPKPGQGRVDPTASDPEVYWGSYAVSKVQERCLKKIVPGGATTTNDSVSNSLGEAFDPPIEVERHYPVVRITRYENQFNPSEARDYIDSVNDGPTIVAGLSCPARTALLTRYDAGTENIDGRQYWKVSFEIMIAPTGQTWDKQVRNQGYYAIGKERIVDSSGAGVVMPYDLDAGGDETSTPIYLEFWFYEGRNFAKLGLNV